MAIQVFVCKPAGGWRSVPVFVLRRVLEPWPDCTDDGYYYMTPYPSGIISSMAEELLAQRNQDAPKCEAEALLRAGGGETFDLDVAWELCSHDVLFIDRRERYGEKGFYVHAPVTTEDMRYILNEMGGEWFRGLSEAGVKEAGLRLWADTPSP